MSVIFHDGKHELYKHYVGNKKWNDNSLLQLNPNSTNDWHLSQKNTESTITSLLERTGKGVKLPGFVTPLLTYITEEETASVIVVKGLHQPRYDGRWLPHITIGTEGRLFHLYYLAARLRLGALPEARGCLDWHCGPPPGRARDGAHAVPLSHRDVLGRSPESPGSRSGCACDQRAPAPRTSTMSSASKRASS